ncbi:hypothetical protein OBBRIDRAFT_836536 [Obba rivulosa]|uniref:Uncharacterized protein n=1 Tax=Obba rivulosa TaxID=1052685 RepID=A0A8E2DMV9_9APHY|nr:hypothetical protein OBBRIDRAFT_836536 [Obba rivulosa]
MSLARCKSLYSRAWKKTYPQCEELYDGKLYRYYEGDDLDIFYIFYINNLKRPCLLLIRPEYEAVYSYLVKLNAQRPLQRIKRSLFALTGQPGIGAAAQVTPAIIVDAESDGIPTTVQLSNTTIVIFDEAGCRSRMTGDPQSTTLVRGSWALTDSSDTVMIPCDDFLLSEASVIQATPPAQERWMRWCTKRHGELCVMNPWEEGELGALLTLLNYNVTDGINIPDAPDGDPVKDYWKSLESTAKKIALSLEQSLICVGALDFAGEGTISSLIFVRASPMSRRSTPQVFIPTTELNRILARAMSELTAAEQAEFFERLLSPRAGKTLAGWLYEEYVHAQLLTRDAVTDIRGCDVEGRSYVLPIANDSISATLQELGLAKPPFYWRPGVSNFPGIDSLIRTDNTIWAIQATIARHPVAVTEGLDKVAAVLGKKVKAWNVVVVSPTWEIANAARDSQLKSDKWTQSKWSAVPIYSCGTPFGAAFESMLANNIPADSDAESDAAFLDQI